jgi:[NiFe] hydrogenase assembly HybE family chaperone
MSPSPPPTAGDDFRHRLNAVEHEYRRIHRERMAGLPILNPALVVSVLDGPVWEDTRIAILVTPWCMSLVALPEDGAAPLGPGPFTLTLPCGQFEMTRWDTPDTGPYGTCPLVSPMGQFRDQFVAEDTAREVLRLLMVPADAPARDATRPAHAETPGLTRRALLRGAAR